MKIYCATCGTIITYTKREKERFKRAGFDTNLRSWDEVIECCKKPDYFRGYIGEDDHSPFSYTVNQLKRLKARKLLLSEKNRIVALLL